MLKPQDCRSSDRYRRALEFAFSGDYEQAREILQQMRQTPEPGESMALVENDLAALSAFDGELASAHAGFLKALEFDAECISAQSNLRQLSPLMKLSSPEAELRINAEFTDSVKFGFDRLDPMPPERPVPKENRFDETNGPKSAKMPASRKSRIAIISLLFNWPSTGGGTVHTAETGKFLSEAGYEVRHFFAQFPEWGLGIVTEPPLAPSEALPFTAEQWTVPEIQSRFRAALRSFEPDWVIVTDSWNSKPILAEAARDYKFFLRIAAQECLCPLNNVRLLFDEGRFSSCPKHQLATPAACCECVYKNGKFTGGLHQAERELVNYGTDEYDRTLRWAFANAEAVLVVNPLIGAMVSPYAKKVCVIPSGFDSARFPKPLPASPTPKGARLQILFAGLVDELMKGFEVVHEACRRLWSERQDFELLATANPPGPVDPFTRYVGWQSQSDLPALMRQAEILVCSTIAEEALGRTAVESMGAGRPVVASRIGGLQFTVVDGATGLLFEPGSIDDLCRKLTRLLDDADLRERLGRGGRECFEEHYTWESILARHYIPLLGEPVRNR